jgi:hypothetical protein
MAHEPIRLDPIRPDGSAEVLGTEADHQEGLLGRRMRIKAQGSDRTEEF